MIWPPLTIQTGDINNRISSRLSVVSREDWNATVHKVRSSRVDWVSGFIFVSVFFFMSVTKYLNKSNLKKELFILAHIFKGYNLPWRRRYFGKMFSMYTFRKQRKMNVVALSTLSILFSIPWHWTTHIQTGSFLLNYNAIINIPKCMVHKYTKCFFFLLVQKIEESK